MLKSDSEEIKTILNSQLPLDRNWPLGFFELHAVDGVFDILRTPPGQGPGAEGDAGEAEG